MISAILVLVGFLAVCVMGYGALEVFAGGMSDNPMAGREAGNEGAGLFIGGLLVLIAVVGIAAWRAVH